MERVTIKVKGNDKSVMKKANKEQKMEHEEEEE
jgi:hypothetical protein